VNVFVGVDGGATRAVALIAREAGDELARLEGPPAVIRTQSPERVAASLAELVQLAIAEAGLPVTTKPACLCCALTGVGRDDERMSVERALATFAIADRLLVTTDVEAALADAFGDGPGIVLVAGTGSIAWGRGPQRASGRAGGWGPRLGDEGSAWAIGMAALRAVVHAEDGTGPRTALADEVAHATRVDDVARLVRWTDVADRAAIAAIAPPVLALAPIDAVAGAIAKDATVALAALVQALVDRLGPWPDAVPVAFAGGLIARGRPLRDAVAERLRHTPGRPPIDLLERDIDGARGAVRLARARHAS